MSRERTYLKRSYERAQRKLPFLPTHLYVQERPKPVEVMIREDPLGRKFIRFHPTDKEHIIGDLEIACCCIPGAKKGSKDLQHYIPVMMILNEFGMVNADFLGKVLGLKKVNARQTLKRLKDYGLIEPVIPGYYRVVAFESKLALAKKTLEELELEIEEVHQEYDKYRTDRDLREKRERSMSMQEKLARGMWGLDPYRDWKTAD